MMQVSKIKRMPLNNDHGFTLIEAMVATLVLTIGILATVSMQSSSLHGNMFARETTEAAAAAVSVIENLRPLNYTTDAELADGTRILSNQDQYAISYTIQRNAIVNNTMLIQVTINWTEAGKPKTVNMAYIKSDVI